MFKMQVLWFKDYSFAVRKSGKEMNIVQYRPKIQLHDLGMLILI